MTDELKPLRLRVAMLTGLIQMRKDLDSDILDMKGQIEQAQENGNLRQTFPQNPTRLLPAAPIEDANLDVPLVKRGRPKGSTDKPILGRPTGVGMTPKQRKAKSKMMKKRWADAKARGDNNPFKPTNKPTNTVSLAKTTKKAASRTRSERMESPRIGFGTNAEFIYNYAVAHGGKLYIKQTMKDALKDKVHNNLGYGVRLSVHLAELKRKGFMAKEDETGLYSLTPLAHKIYQQERTAIRQ